MSTTKRDEDRPAPFQKTAEKTPAEKAAATRARNERAEKRAERKAEQEAAERVAASPEQRTWSCPHCGRGTTLATADGPDGPMLCLGCGLESEGWLPPGVGHGEPELQVR